MRNVQIVSFRPRWERRGGRPGGQSFPSVEKTFLEDTSKEQDYDDSK